ncbi:hypothetical protein FIBSPDRAFT_879839, partial [Athelia psychrophila]
MAVSAHISAVMDLTPCASAFAEPRRAASTRSPCSKAASQGCIAGPTSPHTSRAWHSCVL